MYPIILLMITPAIGSEVIEDIMLPKMPETKVQCLLNKTDAHCPGRKTLRLFIDKEPQRRTKADVNSFISLFFNSYKKEMNGLLPTGYKDVGLVKTFWSEGTFRLFDKVFCGSYIGQYTIRTGYTWWPTVIGLSRKENVSIWKSDNCDKDARCVQAACFPSVLTGFKSSLTFLRNTNPYIDFMIFTAAAFKGVEGTFSSHQLTYNLKGGFMKENSYVTVVYKSTARDYSIQNVDMIYYSIKSGGPLGLIDVCDYMIQLPDPDQDWKCDLRSHIITDCIGKREFVALRADPAEEVVQIELLNKVLENDKFKNAMTSYLGDDLKSKLQDLWFSQRSLFKNVFVDDDTASNSKVKSGYLTFEYGDMKCGGPILDDVRPSNCTAINPNIYQFRSLEGMGITTFDKVNPLFDFTALTLVAARGRLLVNLAPGKTLTLVAESSDECKIAFDVLSLAGNRTKEGDWMMTNFTVSYRFYL